MERSKGISETEEYRKYRDSVLASRPTLIKARENSARSRAVKQKFGKRPKKTIRRAYLRSEEGKETVNQLLKSDTQYRDLLAAGDELTKYEEKFFVKNRLYIKEMIAAGKTSLTVKRINEYIWNQKLLQKIKANEERIDGILDMLAESLGFSSMENLIAETAIEAEQTCMVLLEEAFSTEMLTYGGGILTEADYEDFMDSLPFRNPHKSWEEVFRLIPGYDERIRGLMLDKVFSFLSDRLDSEGLRLLKQEDVSDRLAEMCYDRTLNFDEDEAARRLTGERIDELLRNNPHHAGMMKKIDEKRERARVLREAMLDHIPDRYPDLYPAARNLRRRFVLHIGPTNSGKTYSAIEAMIRGGRGIYLGPLRLLAYEQYERISSSGYKCSLITGEEEILTEGAGFQASTIEMLDFSEHYSTAVIDEAQMVSDEFRGGAWTAAILGINADEVHVCAAPYAKKLIIRLIGECGDSYEVVNHDRLSKLSQDMEPFSFPESVRSGDALIAFSRRSVHGIAAALQAMGRRCSVIYGALPYDVRHEEARRFTEHETDVLVATDAIGMGLNLPIRRVVLLENSKFDGRRERLLSAGEIQQIVGRAGRKGIYNEGMFCLNSTDINEIRLFGEKAIEELSDLSEARISFPRTLLGMEPRVSEILRRWDEIPVQEGYSKASLEAEVKLAEMLETETDDKRLIYDLISIPFDEKNDDLLTYWFSSAREYIKNGSIEIEASVYTGEVRTPYELKDAEEAYSLLDLQYHLCRRAGNRDEMTRITEEKLRLSEKMMSFLSSSRLRGRKCSICGKSIPWDYAYGRCKECHNRLRGNYREDN